MAVETSVDVLVLGTELDPRHIPYAQYRAVGVRPQDDLAEFVGGRQATLRLHVQLELLILRNRLGAEAPDRRLNVLGLHSGDHVGRCKPKTRQPRGVEPDAHGIIEAPEQEGLPDARRARELVDDADNAVVGDEQWIELVALAVKGDQLQEGR